MRLPLCVCIFRFGIANLSVDEKIGAALIRERERGWQQATARTPKITISNIRSSLTSVVEPRAAGDISVLPRNTLTLTSSSSSSSTPSTLYPPPPRPQNHGHMFWHFHAQRSKSHCNWVNVRWPQFSVRRTEFMWQGRVVDGSVFSFFGQRAHELRHHIACICVHTGNWSAHIHYQTNSKARTRFANQLIIAAPPCAGIKVSSFKCCLFSVSTICWLLILWMSICYFSCKHVANAYANANDNIYCSI